MIVILASGDLVASGAKYHGSCLTFTEIGIARLSDIRIIIHM